MSDTETFDPTNFVRNEKCGGCAFRPGTVAHNQPTTALMAKLCVLSGEAFLCNHDREDHEPSGVCRGFMDAFEKRVASGAYKQMPEWKAKLYRALNQVVREMEDKLAAGEPLPDDIRGMIAAACEAEGL